MGIIVEITWPTTFSNAIIQKYLISFQPENVVEKTLCTLSWYS